MLAHAMGPRYTFCHSGFSVRCPGNDGSPFHQDFAYGPAPYSSPEHSPTSDLAVVQILYYPSGFKRGDNHLRVMPGSHKISAFVPELEGPELQRGSDHETALIDIYGLTPLELELPPGSMVRPNPPPAPQRCTLRAAAELVVVGAASGVSERPLFPRCLAQAARLSRGGALMSESVLASR